MKKINANTIIWLVYISLLIVLLPHTAWAFSQFEPSGPGVDPLAASIGEFTAWAAAFAFEAAIAVFTHKLAKRIDATARIKGRWRKFASRYLSSYAFALYIALGVSSMANLAHAAEFGQDMPVLTEWGLGLGAYVVAFGGVLPFVSLMFASALSNVVEAEAEQDSALIEAKKELRLAKQELTQVQNDYARFKASLNGSAALFTGSKRDIILAAAHKWPSLNNAALAIIAGASDAYVSETMKTKEVK